jgi:hypothetical protein
MLNKKLGLIAMLVSVAAGEMWAGTLGSYATGDVLLCFRKNGGGANDLVVDAGPLSTFTNAAPNSRISITQFTGDQLALVCTNSVSWSAFTYLDDTVAPNWALCMTRARSDLNTQTAAWPANGPSAQQYVIVSEISTIPAGANDNLLFNGVNTASAVVEPDSSTSPTTIGNYPNGQAYHTALDPNGGGDNNFGGFAGNPENNTANNFTTAGKVVRSDFYWIPPTGSGAVKFLGYFELSTNGAMSYVAYPTAVPLLKSINAAGNITYRTGIYGNYTLVGTNDLSAPVSTWPAVGTLSSGDNSTHTLSTGTSNLMFYSIKGQ